MARCRTRPGVRCRGWTERLRPAVAVVDQGIARVHHAGVQGLLKRVERQVGAKRARHRPARDAPGKRVDVERLHRALPGGPIGTASRPGSRASPTPSRWPPIAIRARPGAPAPAARPVPQAPGSRCLNVSSLQSLKVWSLRETRAVQFTAAPETGAAVNRAIRVLTPSAPWRPGTCRPQAGLPAAASTEARAATLGVFALLRISVFTYFVE